MTFHFSSENLEAFNQDRKIYFIKPPYLSEGKRFLSETRAQTDGAFSFNLGCKSHN